jgi:DNA repair exonuclease SbcCD nuclease subunit
MKALIFSDLHLHSHKGRIDRLQDCVDVLDWVFQQAEQYKCRYVFFLGDLFHERAKIDVLNYLRTFECFMRHMDGNIMDVFLLVGNHDMYHRERWDVNSIRPLCAIENVNIIQTPLSITLGGKRIDWLPHTENPIKELDKLKEEEGGAGDILFGHVAVNGAMTNTFYGTKSDVIVEYDNDMVPVDIEVFDDWNHVFLGHYHGAQKLSDSVEYVGSPLQISFGEAFQQKHVIILDLETMEKEYVVNQFSPKHLIIKPQDVENEAYDLNGQFVRLEVEDIGKKGIADLMRQISNEADPKSLDTKEKASKKVQEDDLESLADIQSKLQNIQDMLATYMKERGVPDGLDKDHMLKKGLECLEKG